ncbi:hypothetical protein JTM66_35460, partial [Pseudomonas aeruginosa]|nr:hypothetical protein [Pseudomonas aeruginosa]
QAAEAAELDQQRGQQRSPAVQAAANHQPHARRIEPLDGANAARLPAAVAPAVGAGDILRDSSNIHHFHS